MEEIEEMKRIVALMPDDGIPDNLKETFKVIAMLRYLDGRD